MNHSAMIHPYDPRAASSAAMNRAVMAPHYMPVSTYSAELPSGMMPPNQRLPQHHQDLFPFGSYTTTVSNSIAPAFAHNFGPSQRPLPPMVQTSVDTGRPATYQHHQAKSYMEGHNESPVVKADHQWNLSAQSPGYVSVNSKVIAPIPLSPGSEVNFKTEVDTLMKTIQTKSSATQEPTLECAEKIPLVDGDVPKENRKRYQCTIKGCNKKFFQKTHLDIHERSHTGVKPYEPGCDSTFSQLGNLRTHERRHTGERPYQCSMCDKRFAQRGNVRAHMAVHQNRKPFECKLDDCGKKFTQLGNLKTQGEHVLTGTKSHQNKFHIETLRDLTTKFASIQDGDLVPAADKELWEYFAELYKNSNKGIKGRGRDRKVGPRSTSMHTDLRGFAMTPARDYGVGGAGRGNLIGTMMARKSNGQQYEMFDADDASQTSGHSTIDTCYDDAPGEPFDETARGGDLAFGDRMY